MNMAPIMARGERRQGWLAVAGGALLLVFLAGLGIHALLRRDRTGFEIQALDGLARTHYERGEYAQAADIYRTVLARNPDVHFMRFYLGKALYRAGDYAGAEENFRAAIARQIDTPQVIFDLGAAQYQLGRLDAARETWGGFLSQYAAYYPAQAALISNRLGRGISSIPAPRK